MAIQKNFVVKNGIEVNDNLIFADKDKNTVGLGTTLTPEKLQVNGGIGATSLVVTGVGTIPTLRSTDAFASNGYINVGLVTSITGVGLTYTNGNFGIVNANTAAVEVPVFVTDAFVPGKLVVVVPTAKVVGPCGPCGPVGPAGPCGKTKFNVCVGDVPVIVAEADPPCSTVPMLNTLEGPGPPIIPSIPLGKVRFNIAADAVPTLTTDAGVEALTVVTEPTDRVPEGPCGPG